MLYGLCGSLNCLRIGALAVEHPPRRRAVSDGLKRFLRGSFSLSRAPCSAFFGRPTRPKASRTDRDHAQSRLEGALASKGRPKEEQRNQRDGSVWYPVEGHKSARLEGIHNSTCEDDESFNEPNREQYFLRLRLHVRLRLCLLVNGGRQLGASQPEKVQ